MTPLDEALTHGCWHLICHRSEVAQADAWLRLSWPLGDLAVWNDNGEIVAFDNLCPHRGTRFFVGDSGSGRAVCPYHGWAFRDGEMRIPKTQDISAPDRARATLHRFQTAWCGDFLFVGVAPRTPLAEQLGDLAATLQAIGADIADRRDFSAYEFQCDWRVAIENALESDHVNLIHGDSLASLAFAPGEFTFQGANSIWRTTLGNTRMAKGLNAMRRLFDIGWDFEGYANIHVFPFSMLSSTFGYSWSLQSFYPGDGVTSFGSRLLAARQKSAGAVDDFFASSAAMNRQVFEEDAAICARVSPAYDLSAPDRIFAASEARLRHFQATLAAFA